LMIRQLTRAFSTVNPNPSGKFNLTSALGRLKSAFRAPIKHLKRNIEPTGVDYGTMTNTTEEAFDEVSQEWQALIVGNPYDVNTFNMLEQAMIQNHGTVDNPHVVFTSDAPFRYVGCTGQANEDDYEGHEMLIFMLREGPLQRCPSCGQVYKLVRLRNEFSPEMDYYLSTLIPYAMEEMGEMDTTINMSLTRFQKDSYEYSQFEVPSRMVYNLVNPDEHDRLLTDPAYRLERAKKLEEKLYVYLYSLKEIEKEYIQNHGPLPRIPINKVDYETLIEVEKAIMKMDRVFRRVDKFNNRKYIDRENHERREKRMLERAQRRWENNYTLFYGGLSEEEQRYRDYFETDLENQPEDEEIESQLDANEILARDDYKLDRYDFVEAYTRNPEEDATSFLEKKAFKFKYRMARDPLDVYQRRQTRMVARQLERFEKQGLSQLLANLTDAISQGDEAKRVVLERKYLDILAKEAINQYHDYFEDDPQEDFKFLDTLTDYQRLSFVRVFENYATPSLEGKGYATIPKRRWDNALGVWQNFILDFQQYTTEIIPKATALANQAEKAQIDVWDRASLTDSGVIGKLEEHGETPDTR